METIKNRYDFVYFFDVENGNPNGDPDSGNLPRIDPETSHGIVTDVCLKRKVRNYVEIVKDGQPPFEIYIKEKAILNEQHDRAYKAIKQKPDKKGENPDAKKWMCDNFYDIRSFGAVMTTGTNCGQVRGPVQLTFSKSIEPIIPLEITITRMAVTTEKESKSQEGGNRTMGRKNIVPYALYRAEGFISPHLAQKTGFNDDDLGLFWEALCNMFDHDRSAARGKMAARKLFVFKHTSALGNAHAHTLFEMISASRARDDKAPARQFSDYSIEVMEDMPEGVELIEKI